MAAGCTTLNCESHSGSDRDPLLMEHPEISSNQAHVVVNVPAIAIPPVMTSERGGNYQSLVTDSQSSLSSECDGFICCVMWQFKAIPASYVIYMVKDS